MVDNNGSGTTKYGKYHHENHGPLLYLREGGIEVDSNRGPALSLDRQGFNLQCFVYYAFKRGGGIEVGSWGIGGG